MRIRSMSLCMSAGALCASIVAAFAPAFGTPAFGAPAAAPDAVRAQAREIFAHIVGIESSIGKANVPQVAKYLAERFEAGGFPAAHIHVLPLGETASLGVWYPWDGSGGRSVSFFFHIGVVDRQSSCLQ